MLRCKFLVMSFPFITVVEKNERQKQLPPKSIEKTVANTTANVNDIPPKKNPEKCDMICLSNLEEIVFYTSTSQCLLNEMKVPTKQPVDYDKYLDYFE